MGSVAVTVIGIIIRHRRVEAGVIVADKIVAIRHQVSLAEATSKSRVKVIDAGIDDGDLDTLASIAGGAELVDLSLDMGREGVRLVAAVLSLLESLRSLFRGDAGARGDLLLDGHIDAAHWPDRLYCGQGGNLVYSLFFIGKVFELE